MLRRLFLHCRCFLLCVQSRWAKYPFYLFMRHFKLTHTLSVAHMHRQTHIQTHACRMVNLNAFVPHSVQFSGSQSGCRGTLGSREKLQGYHQFLNLTSIYWKLQIGVPSNCSITKEVCLEPKKSLETLVQWKQQYKKLHSLTPFLSLSIPFLC